MSGLNLPWDKQDVRNPEGREEVPQPVRSGNLVSSASNEAYNVRVPDGHVNCCCGGAMFTTDGTVCSVRIVDLQQRQYTGLFSW